MPRTFPFAWVCGMPTRRVHAGWGDRPESGRHASSHSVRSAPRPPDVHTRIEDLFLETADSRRDALAAGWELDGILAYLPGTPPPEWVKDVLASCPAQPVFVAWDEGPPRVVYVRTVDGDVYANVAAGTDPADVPPPPAWVDSPPITTRHSRRPDPVKLLHRARRQSARRRTTR